MADTWGNDNDSNPRAGDTPGFGTGGGGSVGGGGGYGAGEGGAPAGGGDRGGGGGRDESDRQAAAQEAAARAAARAAADNAARIAAERAAYASQPPVQQQPPITTPVQQQPPTTPSVPNQVVPGVIPLNIPQTNLPFFSTVTGSTLSPQTIGMPSILLSQMGSPSLPPVPGPLRSEQPMFSVAGATAPYTPSVPAPGTPFFTTNEAQQVPFQTPKGKTISDVTPIDFGNYTASAQKYSNPEALKALYDSIDQQNNLPPGTTARLARVESQHGNNPAAFNVTSKNYNSPLGAFQFTASTGQKYGLVGDGFDYRLDPEKSAQAAGLYASDIAKDLSRVLGRQATSGEIGLGYNQGPAGAKALLSDPNAKADEALAKAYGGDIERARKAIIGNGGDPDAPAKQFTDKLSKLYEKSPSVPDTIMAGLIGVGTGVATAATDLARVALSAPAKFADTLESALNAMTGNASANALTNVPVPAPVYRSYQEAGSSPDVFQGSKASASLGDNTFAVPGGQQTAAQAASSSPQTFGDWLGGLFDNSTRIQELEAEGRYSGLDKEQYAEQFAGGDVSKVQSRIVDFGDGPVVDYYTKGLDQALAEIVTSPLKAIGSALGGNDVNKLPQGSYVRDPRFSDMFSQTEPSRGYGPYGDLTLEEYRKQYGGKDAEPTQKVASPSSETPAKTPAEEVMPPVYTTGIDLRRRVYSGNPLVDFNYDYIV